jgi:hypothetical protein
MAGEWDGGSASKDDTYSDDHCPTAGGGVNGKVGALSAFTTTNITNGKKTTGDVGARWTGQRYEVCAGEQVTKDNWVQHEYTRTAGQPFTRTLLLVKLTSTVTVSGSAKIWKPELSTQWWWDTTANVVEHQPTASFLLPGGEWASLIIAFDPDHDKQARGSGADASNNNQANNTSPFTAGQGQNGDTVGGAQTADSMTKVRAKAKWTSNGGPPSGDNCDVSDEELKLHFEFETWFVAP